MIDLPYIAAAVIVALALGIVLVAFGPLASARIVIIRLEKALARHERRTPRAITDVLREEGIHGA